MAAPTPPTGCWTPSREGAVELFLLNERNCASSAYPQNTDWLWELRVLMYERDPGEEGVARQLTVVLESPDRSASLRSITVPTVTMTGDDDRFINHRASENLYALITNFSLHVFPGTDHEIPVPL